MTTIDLDRKGFLLKLFQTSKWTVGWVNYPNLFFSILVLSLFFDQIPFQFLVSAQLLLVRWSDTLNCLPSVRPSVWYWQQPQTLTEQLRQVRKEADTRYGEFCDNGVGVKISRYIGASSDWVGRWATGKRARARPCGKDDPWAGNKRPLAGLSTAKKGKRAQRPQRPMSEQIANGERGSADIVVGWKFLPRELTIVSDKYIYLVMHAKVSFHLKVIKKSM